MPKYIVERKEVHAQEVIVYANDEAEALAQAESVFAEPNGMSDFRYVLDNSAHIISTEEA